MQGISSSSTKILLYSFWQSSCSWRVRFALHLKGIPYEYKAIDLSKGEQFSPEFERLNPLHFVPVLVDGNVVVSDSFAILMYLEEKYPQNALLPVDPKCKAVNLQASSIVSCSIQPLQMLEVLKYIEEKLGPEERLSWAQHHIERGFIALEKLLKGSSGKYTTGDEVCMADVFLAPQISTAITRFHVDMSKFPTLSKIYEACKVLPAFQASLPECQPDAIVHTRSWSYVGKRRMKVKSRLRNPCIPSVNKDQFGVPPIHIRGMLAVKEMNDLVTQCS